MAVETEAQFQFDNNVLAQAYGECWFGISHPTKVYAAPLTLEAFGAWLREQHPRSEGRQYNAAFLEAMDKMPEGWLFFVNHQMLQHPGLHKPVFVSKTGLAHV